MIKILFQIKENKLFVQEKRRLNTDQKNLINTNVISQNELVFSDDYITKNLKLIHEFVKEIVNNYNLNTLIIKEFKIAPLILKVITNIDNLKILYLLEESILNYEICESIIKTNTVKYVSLYNLPSFLLEMFDKEKITIDSRNEILFSSDFMKENHLENFSSIYYKTTIYLTLPFAKQDEDDFLAFININKYLKNIHINKLCKNDIENILEILDKYKLKNIKIYIEENINDADLIEYLKKINKKNAKTNKIRFLIAYSQEYLENNLMNQIHLNTIKLCIFASLFLICSVVTYVFFSNFNSMQKVEDIQKDIDNVIASYHEKEENEDSNTTDDESDSNTETIPPEENPSTPQDEPSSEKLRDLKALKEINDETVGWLKVNNTNVDYPVVQHNDNEYYLTYNFKNEKDNSGWVYMDYRADPVDLSQNTIIFGHNWYYSGIMFGTLYKVKSSSWYKNPENQIIEFDSLYKEMKWQIFSIYVVPNTNDYLIANFSTAEKYQNFLDLITNRSIYAFNTPVSTKDKILTLSTCSGSRNNKLVIHAVLMSD